MATIKVKRSEFLAAAHSAAALAAKRTTIPILAHIRMSNGSGILMVSGTDQETGITVPVDHGGEDGFDATCDAKRITSIFAELKGEDVELTSLDNGYVKVKCGGSNFSIVGCDPRDYPAMPDPDEDARWTQFDGGLLSVALSKAAFAASKDTSRIQLNGVLLADEGDSVVAVATDGARLVKYTTPVAAVGGGFRVLVPSSVVGEIVRMCGSETVNLTVGSAARQAGNVLWVRDGAGRTLFARMYETEFPDVNAVIPKKSSSMIEVDRAELIGAMRRASLISDLGAVKVDFTEDSLVISAESASNGSASEHIAATKIGNPPQFGMNAKFMIQGLDAIDGSTVTLGVNDGNGPIRLTSESDPGFLYIAMPYRL